MYFIHCSPIQFSVAVPCDEKKANNTYGTENTKMSSSFKGILKQRILHHTCFLKGFSGAVDYRKTATFSVAHSALSMCILMLGMEATKNDTLASQPARLERSAIERSSDYLHLYASKSLHKVCTILRRTCKCICAERILCQCKPYNTVYVYNARDDSL